MFGEVFEEGPALRFRHAVTQNPGNHSRYHDLRGMLKFFVGGLEYILDRIQNLRPLMFLDRKTVHHPLGQGQLRLQERILFGVNPECLNSFGERAGGHINNLGDLFVRP